MLDETQRAPDRSTLVLTAGDVRELLTLRDCIDVVERILARQGRGETPPPGVLGLHTAAGGFHIKAAAARLDRFYFAAKTNGNYPGNPERHGLPTIQGVLVLCDADDGRPLAVMDSIAITTMRTGAATAVAARRLARAEDSVVTVIGCGVQGEIQLRSLAAVRSLERVFAVDADEGAARRFAAELTETLGIPVVVADEIHDAASQSDICVTCTSSRRPVLERLDVSPGTFVAGVGADHPEKQELDPELLAGGKIVVDSLDQCVAFGDLHHAIEAGAVRSADVHAELGEIVAGMKPGRTSDDEIIIFDSTGTALQDVATAALVYERALADGRGHSVSFSA